MSGITLGGNWAAGQLDGAGGGVCNFGTLSLTDCTLSNNTEVGTGGGADGGIANAGTPVAIASTFSGNTTGAVEGEHASGGTVTNGYLTSVNY